jgi:NAD(P)-dependent dehydrogenase (short-subunit alcohol dehydrogenase family)
MARPTEDPRKQEVKQPFPPQKQDPPGKETEMRPTPDYGEASYRGSGKLAGKTALITGGDSGIGRAVALAFAREGADVAISHLPQEEEDARETAAAVEAAKRRCLAVAGDIQDPQHCRALVTRVMNELGAIDVLVNNAAFQMSRRSILEMSPEEIDRVFRTNVYAMFYLTQAAIPHMKPGASIINTTSIQAYQPKPHLLHYAASKAAIVNFTKGLAHELAERGIPVVTGNTLRPTTDRDDPIGAQWENAAILHAAGVQIAFTTEDTQFLRNLPYHAAWATAWGLPREAAIQAVTLNAARVLGLDDEMGSIQPGRRADLIVTDGDPLQITTRVEGVFIHGADTSVESRHTRLYEQFR